jgi:hypothetical protein
MLAFSCIFYNSTINTYKVKSSVELYPIDVNPIEVYPIEAYLIGKGVVEVSGDIIGAALHPALIGKAVGTRHTSGRSRAHSQRH